MPRISRKELKKDEFATEVGKTYEFVQQRREALIRYGIAAAVAVAIALGAFYFIQHRREQANDALSHAVRVYYAPVPAPADSAEPGMNFPNNKAKYAQAETEFAAVAGKYSWFRAGRVARYYRALAEAQLGKPDDALRELNAVAGMNDAQISPLAKYAAAGICATTGKPDQAEKLYRELADHPSDSVPKDTALLALADVLAGTKPAEAQKILQSIKQQAPNGAAGEMAEKKLAELKK